MPGAAAPAAHGAAGATQGLVQTGLDQIQKGGALFGFQFFPELQQVPHQLLFQFALRGADFFDLGVDERQVRGLSLEQLEELLASLEQFAPDGLDLGPMLREQAAHGLTLSLIQLQGLPQLPHGQGRRQVPGQPLRLILIMEIDEGADGPEVQGQ